MGCWQVKGKGWRYRFERQGKIYSGQWYATKAEAKEARAEHRKKLKQEAENKSEPPGWDLDSLILDYLEEAQRNFQPKTWKYKRYVYQCFRDQVGNLPLDQITEHMVGKYLLTRPSNYNFNFHHKDLKALFNWGISRGMLFANPCLKVKRLSHTRKDLVHITDDEWNRFLLAAGPERPFFLTVFYTLGRISEIFRLRWCDIDWDREEVQLGTRKRKGGGMEYDWLPMPSELAQELRALYRRRPRQPESEFIFVSPRTGQHYKDRRRLIKNICTRAGIRTFGYHAIRHRGADWLMNNGEDLRTISRFLRHKSLATTENYLRRRPDESLRRAARTLQNGKPLTNPLMEESGASSPVQ